MIVQYFSFLFFWQLYQQRLDFFEFLHSLFNDYSIAVRDSLQFVPIQELYKA